MGLTCMVVASCPRWMSWRRSMALPVGVRGTTTPGRRDSHAVKVLMRAWAVCQPAAARHRMAYTSILTRFSLLPCATVTTRLLRYERREREAARQRKIEERGEGGRCLHADFMTSN